MRKPGTVTHLWHAKSLKKDQLIDMSLHIVETLIVSMKSIYENCDHKEIQMDLAVFALYLAPFESIILNLPYYEQIEDIYDKAKICLKMADLQCPCMVCLNYAENRKPDA